jgi:hypothetical protein
MEAGTAAIHAGWLETSVVDQFNLNHYLRVYHLSLYRAWRILRRMADFSLARSSTELRAPDAAPPDEVRWLDYLNRLEKRKIVRADVVLAAKLLWSNLRARVSSLTLPDASPSNAGGLFMSWDRNGKHLELEVLGDTTYEWFYRERVMDTSDGGPEPLAVDSVPGELVARLNEVFDAGR